MLPFENPGGTIKKVIQRVASGKTPEYAVKANQHKHQMFEHSREIEKLQAKLNLLKDYKSAASGEDGQNEEIEMKRQIEELEKDILQHTEQMQHHKKLYAEFSYKDQDLQKS